MGGVVSQLAENVNITVILVFEEACSVSYTFFVPLGANTLKFFGHKLKHVSSPLKILVGSDNI